MGLGELAKWLDEMREKCRRIAATMEGPDRQCWLQDAARFEAAIKVTDWASDNGLFDTEDRHQ